MYKQKLCLALNPSYKIPYDEQIRLFKVAGFDKPLSFELTTQSKPGRHENDKYAAMPFESFVAQAYNRACRVASLVIKEREGK